jgi:hypothetical protein
MVVAETQEEEAMKKIIQWWKSLATWQKGALGAALAAGGYGAYLAVADEKTADDTGTVAGVKAWNPITVTEEDFEEQEELGTRLLDAVVSSLMTAGEEVRAGLASGAAKNAIISTGSAAAAAAAAAQNLPPAFGPLVKTYWDLVAEQGAEWGEYMSSTDADEDGLDELLAIIDEAGLEASEEDILAIAIPEPVLEKWYYIWKEYAAEMASVMLEWIGTSPEFDERMVIDAAAEERAFIAEVLVGAKVAKSSDDLVAVIADLSDAAYQLQIFETALGPA